MAFRRIFDLALTQIVVLVAEPLTLTRQVEKHTNSPANQHRANVPYQPPARINCSRNNGVCGDVCLLISTVMLFQDVVFRSSVAVYYSISLFKPFDMYIEGSCSSISPTITARSLFFLISQSFGQVTHFTISVLWTSHSFSLPHPIP
jgi:hypothetical protein